MVRAIQKVVKNGSSAQITLIRPLLYALKLLPGDQVEVWTTDDGVAHFRPWISTNALDGRSPGLMHEKPEALAK